MASAEVATPEQLVGEAENHRMVAEVVSGLEEPFRQTLVLHYYDGLSSAEIARRLGLPEGTIRSRIKRGLDRVRVRLDARHGGDRRAWVRSLLPLVPVVPRTGSSLLLLFKAAAAVAAASFAAVVLTVLFARGPASPVAGGEPPHAPLSRYAALVTRTQDGQAGEPGGSGPLLPGTTSPLPGPLEPRLLACRGRLAVAHEQRIALEADLREWDHDFLYALGEPNPAAELALAAAGHAGARAGSLRCPASLSPETPPRHPRAPPALSQLGLPVGAAVGAGKPCARAVPGRPGRAIPS